MRKKLLIASDSFLPRWDGIARFVYEIVPKLKKKYDITILAPKFNNKNIEMSGVKIIQFPVFKKFKVGDFPPVIPSSIDVEKYVKNSDIVFVQQVLPICVATIKCAKKFKKPILFYGHAIEWEIAPRAIFGPIFIKKIIGSIAKTIAKHYHKKCDLLLVSSKNIANKFSRAGIKTKKIIVPQGINFQKFKPVKNKAKAKSSLGLNPKNLLLGYYGRIAREKDLTTLLNAFKKIKKELSDVKLMIVGDGVTTLVNKFKKEKDVIVIGSVNNGEKYLQAMDIYVLPSLTETTSLTTLEAMACEVPVVTTKVGVGKGLIKEGYNGILFPKKDAKTLAEKLKLLIQNKQMRILLGKNARKSVQKFTWDRTVNRIEEAIKLFK